MKPNEILSNINSNGGFDNLNKWTVKEIATWVRANFNCTHYASMKVARQLL